MTTINHTLGFPRVGLRRELKKAQESYGQATPLAQELLAVGRELRAVTGSSRNRRALICCRWGFRLYDHVLTTSLSLATCCRHQNKDGSIDIDTLFRIGRGRAPTGEPPPLRK